MRRLAMAVLVVAGVAGQAWAEEQRSGARVAGPLTTYAAADLGTGTSVGPRLAEPFNESGAREFAVPPVTRRPGALAGLYASLTALNALDVYSTQRALSNGARELNPIVASSTGNLGATLAIKAATTTSSIYLAEKLWKKNRVGAIVTMVAVNGATAAIVAHNFRNAR